MEGTSFKQRRESLMDLMGDNAVAIIPSAKYTTRSHDTEYPFRQDSNFKYLSGFNEPDALLVINAKKRTQTLFLRENNEFEEMWMGKRLGLEKAKELFELDETFSIKSLETELANLLDDCDQIYLDLYNSPLMETVLKANKSLASRRKKSTRTPQSLKDLTPLVGRMRLIKEDNEILAMKKAAHITSLAHQAAMAKASPELNEKDVHDLMEYIFKKEGGDGNAYDSIVAGGKNALILHYINNNENLNDGELLLIDAGSQVNLYASDVTRTFPINGVFTGPQKDLYELVLTAQKNAIALSRPGKTISEIHEETASTLAQGLIDLKILETSLEEAMEKDHYKKYYPHGTSHWLGLDVHDNCPYKNEDMSDITLEERMVFTIEPGLYFPENDLQVPDQFRGIGIRTEDDIMITEKGHENLTSSIPKEIKEIEEACKRDWKEFI